VFACADVDYRPDGSARAALLLFTDWAAASETGGRIHRLEAVAPYEPGAFARRELPCLLPLLSPLVGALKAVVIDGYVTLDGDGRPGLGWALYAALGRAVPVVGVAKTAFRGSPHAEAVRRGETRALYVTAAGLGAREAAAHVQAMAGDYRVPTLLKRVDRACRDAP
jgi:deoxyribonuclease V